MPTASGRRNMKTRPSDGGAACAGRDRNGGKPVRGRPRLDHPKTAIKLRIDADIVRHFRNTGPGWQTRINDTLRKATKLKVALSAAPGTAARVGVKRWRAKALNRHLGEEVLDLEPQVGDRRLPTVHDGRRHTRTRGTLHRVGGGAGFGVARLPATSPSTATT